MCGKNKIDWSQPIEYEWDRETWVPCEVVHKRFRASLGTVPELLLLVVHAKDHDYTAIVSEGGEQAGVPKVRNVTKPVYLNWYMHEGASMYAHYAYDTEQSARDSANNHYKAWKLLKIDVAAGTVEVVDSRN